MRASEILLILQIPVSDFLDYEIKHTYCSKSGRNKTAFFFSILFVWTAITEYPRLDGLKPTEVYFSWCWRLGSPRSRASMAGGARFFWALARAFSLCLGRGVDTSIQ